MKVRLGFVSNSSSSSFCIPLSDITKKQAYQITNHIQYTRLKIDTGFWNNEHIYTKARDMWSIFVDDGFIMGTTFIDNFDMTWFLRQIGIKNDYVQRGQGQCSQLMLDYKESDWEEYRN